MNLQSLSTQTTRSVFDELKDQTIRRLEAKVQNLKLIIAGLVIDYFTRVIHDNSW